ncbi:unnamed protein product [Effrenium voratum]|nr:unnamed protein product [Effrenium voratum]
MERRLAPSRVLEKIDLGLGKVEEAVIQHQASRLQRWADSQRAVLERALQVEQAIMAKNASITSDVMKGVSEDIGGRKKEHATSEDVAMQAKEDCDRLFRQELRQLSQSRRSWAQKVIDAQAARLSEAFEETMAGKWNSLEDSFQRSLWEHHTAAHRAGLGRQVGAGTPAEDLREVWQSGELKAQLANEKKGWGRSQRADLEHLQQDVDAEMQPVLDKLEKAIRSSLPKNSEGEPDYLRHIRSVAEEAKQQLEDISAEEARRTEDSLESAWRFEDQQRQLFETQLQARRKRFEDMQTLRQLKLQLLRWRLDYQRTYHEAQEPAEAPQLEQRFALCRRLVKKLWAEVPRQEVHRFLQQVAQALSKSGKSAAMLKVYHKELKRLGALPMVPHARSPELLQVWLDEDGG